MSTYNKIIQLLQGIDIKVINHPPTHTSQESALARGESINIGGKALVMKTGDNFGIFVLSAARTIDSRKLKDYFKVRRIRFATKEELDALTGLPSGAVPPFGRPVFDLNLYADNSILENEFIAFNAGSLTTSIKMKVEDYIKIVNPVVFSFSVKTQETNPSPLIGEG